MDFCFFSRNIGWVGADPIRVFTSSVFHDVNLSTQKYSGKTGMEISEEIIGAISGELMLIAKAHLDWWYYPVDTVITTSLVSL